MTTSNRPARTARGRVVVVGRHDLGDMPDAVVAENLFDAVGEVMLATAARPVDAVVMPSKLVPGSSRNTVEAFRRIDPSVRLILVASCDEEQARIRDGANGFDDVLVEPLSAGALKRAIDGDGAVATPKPPRRTDEPPIIEPIISTPPPEAPDAPDTPDTPDAPDAPDPEELGDTDLVEAILSDESGLGSRALQLMIQQTGWSDLAVTDTPPDGLPATPPRGPACVELRYGRRCYGMLSSRLADARKLDPWAEWLARWMALDHGYRRYRTMAYRDELTGAWNRRFYNTFMKTILRKAARTRRAVTVLVFDLDDFKRYNDDFGHDAGDEVLCETVRLLESVIRSGDRVCRIGGDEFAVIFADLEGPREPGSNPPETVGAIAVRFQDQVCKMKFPKLGLDAPGTLSISGGLATYPWDGRDAAELLRHADRLALQSKREGKNVITFGPGASGSSRQP